MMYVTVCPKLSEDGLTTIKNPLEKRVLYLSSSCTESKSDLQCQELLGLYMKRAYVSDTVVVF